MKTFIPINLNSQASEVCVQLNQNFKQKPNSNFGTVNKAKHV